MASTYSSRLRLELIATGEKSGSWGTVTNTNLGTLLEEAIAGVAAVNFGSDANYTLTAQNGSTDESRRAVLSCTSTGSLTATRDLIVPTATKIYLVYNNTTGGQSIRVKTSAGTGITIANGKKAMVYCDGTNVVDAISSLPASTTIGAAAVYVVGGTDVAVADGGTGASTAAGARTALGLVIGTDVQAYSANLATYSGIAPSTDAQTLLAHTFAQMRTDLGLVIGTNVQAYNANLTTYASVAPSANAQTLLGHTFSQMRTDLGLVIGTDVQAYSANLATYAGVAPSANAQTLLGHTFAQMRTDLSLGTSALLDETTTAQLLANTSGKVVSTDKLWSATAPVALSVPATATVTISNASPAVVSHTSHDMVVGQSVVFTTTGALPTGLTAGTRYYVISAGFGSNSYQVSATRGGSAINTSSAGSGTHTATPYVAIDFSLGVNFKVTLNRNVTFDSPLNAKDGQCGNIVINQDGTGSRTAAWASEWGWASGSAPTLSTTASARDLLGYYVDDATHWPMGNLAKAFA